MLVSLALAVVVVGSISIGTAHAAPAGPQTITKHGQEIVHFSPQVCKQRQAAAHSKDSNLCTYTHGWTSTSVGSYTIAPDGSSCWTGTQWFHDWTSDCSRLFWRMNLDEEFKWVNNMTCGAAPFLISGPTCYFAFYRQTDFTEHGCYSYQYHSTSGQWYSEAAVHSAYIVEHWPGGNNSGFAQSIRRECYSYDAPDSCVQTNWNGL
jgi:hypothetical protein